MLDPARVHRYRAIGLREGVRGALDGLGRNSGFLRDRTRVPGKNGIGDLLESACLAGNEVPSLQAVPQNYVQQSHVQRQVGSRPDWQVDVRVAADRRHARIYDDELSTSIAATPQVFGCDWRAFRDI